MNKEQKAKYNHEWYLAHREEVLARQKKLPYRKEYNQRYRQALKAKVLTYYSDGKLACVRCGFSDLRALSIDHIHGNGFQDMKNKAGGSGDAFYLWLKRNSYPEGYQTLCMNCQFIKRSKNEELFRKK